MMCKKEDEMYGEVNNVKVLSLWYIDTSYSFDVYLPHESDDFDAFLAGLTGTILQELLASTRRETVDVSFHAFEDFIYFYVIIFILILQFHISLLRM